MDKISGPDLTAGISATDLKPGQPLLGHIGKDPILLVRLERGFSAVSAVCTHYHGPLEKGLVVGDSIRCPWHHACFSLKSGEVLGAPGLNPLQRWRVEEQDGLLFVREKLPALIRSTRMPAAGVKLPESVLIVGGGAAGEAAASTLRFHDYQGPVTILSAEDSLPPDRPNLSKDYLAGTAPAEWVPVRNSAYYERLGITLLRNTQVTAVDRGQKKLRTADGREFGYGALLLATGAEPIRLTIPGATLPHVHYLRTLADSDAIIKGVQAGAQRALVIGASFIGLEVAAALRARGLEVHVVGPEARPLEQVLGPELGDFVRSLHEQKGVVFHLGITVTAITENEAVLSDGGRLAADLVVIGIGVRPVTDLAGHAGLARDKGVRVDEYLETSAAGIYAAGDIARWPDRRTGLPLRVEHWAVAQRQGQTAARNMLGHREPFTAVPFFWSQHYDVSINYVGHAEAWDRLELDGDPMKLDCTVNYKRDGKLLAQATVFRDRQNLETEAAMELQ